MGVFLHEIDKYMTPSGSSTLASAARPNKLRAAPGNFVLEETGSSSENPARHVTGHDDVRDTKLTLRSRWTMWRLWQ